MDNYNISVETQDKEDEIKEVGKVHANPEGWSNTDGLKKCMSNLSTILGSSDSKEWDEIKPIVENLENAWHLNKFPGSIQKAVIDLSEMIRIKDVRQAESSYLAIVMECDQECKKHLTGMRKLIDKIKGDRFSMK